MGTSAASLRPGGISLTAELAGGEESVQYIVWSTLLLMAAGTSCRSDLQQMSSAGLSRA
jgi:hypothetical protein